MTRHRAFPVTLILTLALGLAATAGAQNRLTLSDALHLATDHSETVAIARAAEAHADAGVAQAVSQKLPQVSFTGTYSRTLASEFSRAFENPGPVCDPLNVDPSKPLADRVSELERAAGCGALGSGFSFANLPFGQKNVYQLGFSFAQAIYAGGRISAQQRLAETTRRSASLATSTTEAQLALDATRAFYDAALADRLVTIAESTLAQASAAYDQTRLAFDAGRQPEFELLRAQVARDNERPTVIRRRADRDIAYLRLRQLLELPAGAPLELDVDLETAALPPPEPFAEALSTAAAAAPADGVDAHLAVRQSAEVVALREDAVTIAHAERLPSVSLGSSLAKVGYPSDGVFPGTSDFRTNWSLSATVAVPLYTGGRLAADEAAARADLDQAHAQLKQARELAELDAATARQDLAAAQAVWEASASTVEQAQRAYQIAELRNREGLSTQLELSDSRLSLQVAQATRAQAARDLQVARARLALVPMLPAGSR
jgi:outer membrane protein TolC